MSVSKNYHPIRVSHRLAGIPSEKQDNQTASSFKVSYSRARPSFTKVAAAKSRHFRNFRLYIWINQKYLCDDEKKSTFLENFQVKKVKKVQKNRQKNFFYSVKCTRNLVYSKTPFIATPSNQMPPIYRKNGGVPTSSPPAWTTDYQHMRLNE